MKLASHWRTVALLTLLNACQRPHDGLPYYRSRELTPEWLTTRTANAPDMHRIAPFAFTDHHGTTVTNRAFRGRVTLVHFFYTNCGRVCPRAFDSIARLLRQVPQDSTFQVLSYTVQPGQDSVAALKAYANQHALNDARWHLLTGPWGQVDSLAANSFFVNLHDGRSYGTDDLAHTETLVLVDPDARIRGVYNATLALDMEQIARDAGELNRGTATAVGVQPKRSK
jgi:protein SCO1/2